MISRELGRLDVEPYVAIDEPYLGKNYRITKDYGNSNEHLELRMGQFLVSGSNISGMYKK